MSGFRSRIENEWNRKETVVVFDTQPIKVWHPFQRRSQILTNFCLARVLLSLPTHIQVRRCDDTITFSPTIRILKTTIIGPFEGRFIPEDKHSITPRNSFLVKVLSQLMIPFL